jgi:hypothetical protein
VILDSFTHISNAGKKQQKDEEGKKQKQQKNDTKNGVNSAAFSAVGHCEEEEKSDDYHHEYGEDHANPIKNIIYFVKLSYKFMHNFSHQLMILPPISKSKQPRKDSTQAIFKFWHFLLS